MWSRAAHISDAELTSFNIVDDLVEVNDDLTNFVIIIVHGVLSRRFEAGQLPTV